MRIQSLTIKALVSAAVLVIGVAAQQKPSKPPATQPPQSGNQEQKQDTPPQAPKIDRRKIPLADRPNLTLDDVNTEIGVDRRVIVMMAALNIAGYDYEPGSRPLSALRQQVREDLATAKPDLVRRLRDHFSVYRKGKTDAAAVAPYLSLALSLTQPPAFTIDVPEERLPDDVREITSFLPLLEEFYGSTGFSKLLPKYTEAYLKAAQSYPQAAGMALGSVLFYLHTEPVLQLPPLYIARRAASNEKKSDKSQKDKQADQGKKTQSPLELPDRIRQFVIMPDLLNSTGSANLRVVRDTYFLLIGPSTEPNVEAMRRGFLVFVIDPLSERQVKEVAAIRGPLKNLMESRGDKLDPEYSRRSAYYLITDSLVRATDARLDVLGIAARRRWSEDEAIYQLSLAYDRGAVLVYHFYDQMKAYEMVGINLRDYFSNLIQNIDFEQESKRLDQYAQRIARYKQLRTEASLAPLPSPTISNADEKIIARIVEANQMIQARRYTDAKVVLEAVLKERPDNARAFFGLGEISSKQASAMGQDDPLEETLYAAVEYYRLAIKNSSPETEKWLAQRGYVAAAKILDFIAENNQELAEKLTAEATAAYELAVKLGKVEGGVYEEAANALKQRLEKPKQ